MTLQAVTFGRESTFPVVAGTARCAGFHELHGRPFAVTVREQLGVAIGACEYSGMELMAEIAGYRAGLAPECHLGRNFKSGMAFSAITCGRKSFFAIVAGTARFTLEHVFHGGFSNSAFIRKSFGVAIFASVGLCMEIMAEGGWCDPL